MELKHYETVFILTPVLSDQQTKDAVAKFKNLIAEQGGQVYYEEEWGLRKLAYPIQKKKTGFYYLLEFKAEPTFLAKLETEYKRDEQVIRYLTISLDKYAIAYNERRRQNKGKKAAEKEEVVA